MAFTPRQLEMTLKLARSDASQESAGRLALDRIAAHGDGKAIDRAIKDLRSDRVWRSR